MSHISPSSLYQDVKSLLTHARSQTVRQINTIMVHTYRQIGERIVLHEQQGEQRAEYGKHVLKELAQKLQTDFGDKFGERHLRHYRQFYLSFPIRNTVRSELTRSHYRTILAVPTSQAREYYIQRSIYHGRSARTLDRNIKTLMYDRMSAMPETIPSPEEIHTYIADPMVLDFLGLDGSQKFSENDLETAIISNLQQFLLACGHGFSFVARQKRIMTETNDFYIDLVFYNYLLKCFVIIDLKVGELKHQDIGQIDMYVRMYDDLYRLSGDNPTIGIVLSTYQDQTIVKYSVLQDSNQLFASTYMMHLPSEDELQSVIQEAIMYHEAG